jgi:hypothetical protein
VLQCSVVHPIVRETRQNIDEHHLPLLQLLKLRISAFPSQIRRTYLQPVMRHFSQRNNHRLTESAPKRSNTKATLGRYRKRNPDVKWRKKWNRNIDPFKGGRVLVVDCFSRGKMYPPYLPSKLIKSQILVMTEGERRRLKNSLMRRSLRLSMIKPLLVDDL